MLCRLVNIFLIPCTDLLKMGLNSLFNCTTGLCILLVQGNISLNADCPEYCAFVLFWPLQVLVNNLLGGMDISRYDNISRICLLKHLTVTNCGVL